MNTIFNNIWPASVNVSAPSHSSYRMPPLHDPLPNYILPPGFTPQLPQAAIPANPGNIKGLLSKLPSLFNLNHG